MGTTVLTATTTTATVKKSAKAVELTDEALLSAYGDPNGETVKQLAMAHASKIDNDCADELLKASLSYDGSASAIGYAGIVSAIDVFGDEADENTAKVIYVHPSQKTTIRLDADFKDKNKYGLDVVMNGVIGEIGGALVKASKKVKRIDYDVKTSSADGYTEITSSNIATYKGKFGTKADGTIVEIAVGQYVKALTNQYYLNPIVVVDAHDPNEEPSADGFATTQSALTIYMKRDTMVEADRDILKGTNVIASNTHFVTVLSNESKVVLAKFKAN